MELENARQEVVALRSRVQQLEADTGSSSSLEQKQLSLRQVRLNHDLHRARLQIIMIWIGNNTQMSWCLYSTHGAIMTVTTLAITVAHQHY